MPDINDDTKIDSHLKELARLLFKPVKDHSNGFFKSNLTRELSYPIPNCTKKYSNKDKFSYQLSAKR